jgi:hypothetical protein
MSVVYRATMYWYPTLLYIHWSLNIHCVQRARGPSLCLLGKAEVGRPRRRQTLPTCAYLFRCPFLISGHEQARWASLNQIGTNISAVFLCMRVIYIMPSAAPTELSSQQLPRSSWPFFKFAHFINLVINLNSK